MARSSGARPSPAAPQDSRLRRRFWVQLGLWTVVLTAVTVYLADSGVDVARRLVVGNLAFTVALTYGCVRCFRAARRRSSERWGWAWMGIGLGLGALGQVAFTLSAVRGEVEQPSLVAAAVTYLAYAPPMIIAPFCFRIPRERLISRFRRVVDALVITISVLLVGEVTVLSVVRESMDSTRTANLAGFVEPLADITVCAVVLTLGMRQPPERRLAFLWMGAGLLSLGITDSIYVRLLAQGAPDLTATPLMAGWIACPVLIGLATGIRTTSRIQRWNLDLASRLVPYIPVVAAAVVLFHRSVGDDPFLVVGGVGLLVIVAARQVMIVYENLNLTRDLEAKVAARTVELATLGSIVTSSQDAIVGIGLDRIIRAWNPAAEQLFGYRGDEVLGQPGAFLPLASAERVQDMLVAAQRGEALESYELSWDRPDGTVVPVSMTVSPIRDEGVVTGVSVSARDITESRQAAEVLEQAREDALQSARAKSEFLATMSHEIRTPMNGVIGLIALLMDTELDAQQRGYAEGVHSAGQALLDVINDILDFSKLEAGKVVLETEDFDLRRLVDEVGNLLAPAAFAKGLELLVDYPPSTPTAVRGDPARIRQILLNLASNAVKFTSVGEVAIRVLAAPVVDERLALRIEVTDTGIGIAAQDQEKLFESFSQADASTTRRYGGTGLGLAICRRLVEVMDGRIGLSSEPGSGSTFWFTLDLPIATVAPPVAPEQLGLPLPPGLRGLVVDDNATNRTILEAQLSAWGVRVDLVDDACSALERLRRAAADGQKYDFAILDMLMPVVDGIELARTITTDPELTGLPMLMLTSAQRPPSALLDEVGIKRWLNKPVRASSLHKGIGRLVLREGASRPARLRDDRPAQPTGRGRVLVVEDNELNQLVAAGMVARLGFEAEVAGNGVEALAALAAGRFDVVLMDCHMPVMDGFAATREIRRREAGGCRTPVIALTAGALVADRERCLDVGMDDYVSKPVEAENLAAALDRWVPEPVDRSGDDHHAPEGEPAVGLVESAEAEPVVDTSRLEGLAELTAADGTSLLASFVSSFNGRAAGRVSAIRQSVDAGDEDALGRAAHELKGSAATIGAVRVAGLCADLERAGTRALVARPRLLDELEDELEAALRALDDAASAYV